MINDGQIDIAVKYWSALFNKSINKQIEQTRFEKSLRKVIADNKDVIEVIALQVIPHSILSKALKDAKAHQYSFPFKKVDTWFDKGKVFLFERDKFVKELT